MTTLTASLWSSGVKNVHAGLNATSFRVATAATLSASSVILLARIPDQATIQAIRWTAGGADTDNTLKVGVQKPEGSTSGSVTISESAIGTEQSISTVTTVLGETIGKLPYHLSISDEALPRWAWVTLVNSAALDTGSQSFTLQGTVFYSMDEDNAG